MGRGRVSGEGGEEVRKDGDPGFSSLSCPAERLACGWMGSWTTGAPAHV